MAKSTSEEPKKDGEPEGLPPVPPQKRQVFQRCFQQGAKVAAAGQFDYATEMFTQCVIGDPGNPEYVRSFLANLVKKYNNNKKGATLAGMKTAGMKTALQKTKLTKNWVTIITSGIEILKINPWDTGTLVEIGNACETLKADDCQLEYLKLAFDADHNDTNINRVYARALGRTGHFDQAMSCWQRVKNAKPTDEEAIRAMNNLAVEKTIHKGGYEEAQSTKDVRLNKATSDEDEGRMTLEERMMRAIDKEPTNMASYVELSDFYQRDEQFAKAEEILQRALQASGGGDLTIRERVEDVQLRVARQTLIQAEKKARDEKTEAAVNLYNNLKADLNAKEVTIYASRCERYPTNMHFKYELAVRLQRAKKFGEAIKLFQDCRSDLKRRGHVYLSLGQCFAFIKQYKMALDSFEKASAEFGDKDIELKKDALYNAGKLAVHLKELDKGDKLLSDLAGLDFGYKDVAQWLDKLAKLREDGGDPADL
ncbi:MAG: hypothetical protein JSS27_18045 [Planctomycetes bacterium]|nr:hypothetical protein [Planctomycetota bacterium]